MFHPRDHGGPHFQRGKGKCAQRYDAKTCEPSLDPLKHGNKTPPELSKTEVKILKQSSAWNQMTRFFNQTECVPLLLVLPGQEQMFDNMINGLPTDYVPGTIY